MCDHCRTVVDYNVTLNGVVPLFSDLKNLLSTLQREIKPPGEHDRDHIAYISTLLAQQTVQKEEWSQFVHFMENKYTRHLVAHDENFTVLLLCWNRNQRSPIHDHSGSSCWVRVLEGTITERRFATNGDGKGGLVEIGAADVGAGGVCYINDSQGLHEMANNQSDACTVTLHVYSPPQPQLRVYSADSGRSTLVDFFTAVAPPRELVGLPAIAPEIMSAPKHARPISIADFRNLVDHTSDDSMIAAHFDALTLTPSEWSSYVQFSDFGIQDVVLHTGTSGYALQMICALPGQHLHRRYRKTHRRIRILYGEATLSSRMHTTSLIGPSHGSQCLAKQPDLYNHSGDYLIALLLTRKVAASPGSPLPPRGVTSSQESQGSIDGGSSLASTRVLAMSGVSESSFVLAPIMTDLHSAHQSPFAALVDELNSLLCRSHAVSDEEEGDDDRTVHVNDVLENTRVDAEDLNAYWDAVDSCGYRFTLFECADFVLTLNLWEPGHRSVAHDHDGAVSWVRVIEGALIDIAYDKVTPSPTAPLDAAPLRMVRNSTMSSEDVCFFGRTAVHALKNKSPVFRAASLHLYVGGGRKGKTYETTRPLTLQSVPGTSRLWHAFEHPFAANEFVSGGGLPCRPSADDIVHAAGSSLRNGGAAMWDVAFPTA